VTLKQIQKQIGEALINNAETSPNLLTLALLGGGVPTDLLGAANNALASSALAGTIVNGNTVARRGVGECVRECSRAHTRMPLQ
jgi:hypothetical protein